MLRGKKIKKEENGTRKINPHQLSALVVLANYGRESFNNVIIPWAAGCQTIGICAYKECYSKPQKAVVGLADLSARKNVRKQLGDKFLPLLFLLKCFWKWKKI